MRGKEARRGVKNGGIGEWQWVAPTNGAGGEGRIRGEEDLERLSPEMGFERRSGKVKSMNIGEVRIVNGRLEGRVATRTIDLPRIGLRKVDSQNPRAPVYEILALNVARRWVQVGALWEAVAKKSGEIFLAGNIDDPSLPEPLPVAFFPTDNGGYSIAWRRDTLRSDFGGTGFGAANYDRMGGGDAGYDRAEESGFGASTAGMDGSLAGADAGFDRQADFERLNG
ncbi:hypothetical protein MBESOW_P3798 [Sphingobium xenophagum]|jgi:uncharacterized protein (DUF736 family)|uniref:DUF736 domain-containing protein n=2 Tax=Sphingobium TaxID=165695 RepID=A0A401J7F8_SPHXE|nr:hypothetical protein MBESOW_P3798 [Sphingobium xenophagum]